MNTDINTEQKLNLLFEIIFILPDQFTFFLSEFDCDKLVSFIEKRKKSVLVIHKTAKSTLSVY